MDEAASPQSSTLARLERELLGGPRVLTVAQLAARLGVPEERVVAAWQPFGLPEDPDEVVFTERDAEVLATLFEAGDRSMLGPGAASSLVRSVGHLTDRLAVWQIEAIVEHLAERYDLDDATARILLLDRLGEIVPLLETQLVHAWRRQLAGHAARTAAQVATAREVPGHADLPLDRAVGFADIVSFTARTAGLSAEHLADVVVGFEGRARDVVSGAGGRTVKTIGDAVFFVADDARAGATVASALAQAFPRESDTPVRVGVVRGRVLARFGDVFGTPVNLAARLTAEAEPGEVLTDVATAQVLRAEPGFVLTPLRERELAGLGLVSPVRVERRAG